MNNNKKNKGNLPLDNNPDKKNDDEILKDEDFENISAGAATTLSHMRRRESTNSNKIHSTPML